MTDTWVVHGDDDYDYQIGQLVRANDCLYRVAGFHTSDQGSFCLVLERTGWWDRLRDTVRGWFW